MIKLNSVLKAGAGVALALCISFGTHSVLAGQARKATGPEIRAALSGRTAFEAGKEYRPWRQFFAADGSTVYFADGPSSTGKWEVRGEQFCSLWPPSTIWVCYDVELLADSRSISSIVWISKDGTREDADLFDGDLTALRSPPKR